jgi:hypothetical protein
VSPVGPRRPTHSESCGFGFPFVHAALWGVDRGWAGPAADPFGFQAFSPLDLPGRPLPSRPGRYEALPVGWGDTYGVAPWHGIRD